MKILGIDPGSRVIGYGVLLCGRTPMYVASGIIRMNVDQSIAQRMVDIHQSVRTIIEQHQPDEVAIEEVFVQKNIKSALMLGQARGAILSALGQSSLEVGEYAPRLVKKSVVGYGHADKKQIQEMVAQLLNLSKVPPQDAADALAVAFCHAQHQAFKHMTKG